MQRILHHFFTLGLVAIVILQLGCQPETDPALLLLDTKISETRVEDLKRSMDFVRSKRQFDIKEFEEKLNSGLNRWASSAVGTDLDWKLDPMVQSLLDASAGYPFAQRISEVSFINTDAAYLQSCAWSKLLGDRMAKMNTLDGFELYRLAADYQPAVDADPEQDPLEPILKSLHEGLEDDAAVQLADTLRCFDWVTRNIQLLPSASLTAEEVEEARLYDSEDLAEAGIPGVGYMRFPSQVLVYGRGDYAEKAQLFINIVTQMGLDAVLLTVDTEGADGESEAMPWCVAVPIGGRFFLFDTRLGIPLPNHRTNGVATLADVKADPELLTWLDLSLEESLADDTQYWVRPEQLDSLQAKVLVTPESVSARMAKLDFNLVDDDEPTLYRLPSDVAQRIREMDSELSVGVWDIGFKTHYYRRALRQALNESSFNNRLAEKVSWYYTDEAYIDGFAVYRTARSVFLHGQFHNDKDTMRGNAIERFFALMYTDDTIRNLSVTPKLQRRHGILRDKNQSAVEYQNALNNVQGQMRLIARDTSYFLAQCHFDNGNLGVASLWLDRIQGKANAERWADGISYLLARSLEGNREYDRALAEYREHKDSAQVHGNLVRARILASMISEASSKP